MPISNSFLAAGPELEGKKSVTLLRANKRLNTVYLLEETFAQLWSYRREAGHCVEIDWEGPADGGGPRS